MNFMMMCLLCQKSGSLDSNSFIWDVISVSSQIVVPIKNVAEKGNQDTYKS